jgi:hypothetical protein
MAEEPFKLLIIDSIMAHFRVDFVGRAVAPGCQIGVTWATTTRLMGCTHSRGVSDWLHGSILAVIN